MKPIERGQLTLWADPIRGGQRLRLLHRGNVVSYERFVRGLCEEHEMRELLADSLRAAPYESFFWETPPVSSATRDRAFELALLDSPALARVAAEPAPFARELARGTGPCITIPNLGGDAWLVVPRAIVADEHYTHLARFVRGAPHAQVDALLCSIGLAVERWWSERDDALWLSTAGLGVHWLHVRLDMRPKYYTYGPYRRFVS